jgi:hypothetical protein
MLNVLNPVCVEHLSSPLKGSHHSYFIVINLLGQNGAYAVALTFVFFYRKLGSSKLRYLDYIFVVWTLLVSNQIKPEPNWLCALGKLGNLDRSCSVWTPPQISFD